MDCLSFSSCSHDPFHSEIPIRNHQCGHDHCIVLYWTGISVPRYFFFKQRVPDCQSVLARNKISSWYSLFDWGVLSLEQQRSYEHCGVNSRPLSVVDLPMDNWQITRGNQVSPLPPSFYKALYVKTRNVKCRFSPWAHGDRCIDMSKLYVKTMMVLFALEICYGGFKVNSKS